jgi:hypothetical protein
MASVATISPTAPKHVRSSTPGAHPGKSQALAVGGMLGAAAVIFWAYRLADKSTSSTHFAVFWVGFLVALLVALFRGLSTSTQQGERTRLLIMFGLVTFLPKFLMSVNSAIYRDEFPHWGQVNAMASSNTLNPPNSFLPIVHNFPGLEVLTLAVHDVTRLSTWHSGQIVVLLAHCASLLLVAALARAVGAGSAGAFAGALVFALNPSFTYFDVQYSYESLALPLALVAVFACLRARRSTTHGAAIAWAAGGVVAALGCTVTHHISAIFMSGMCLAVALLVPSRAVSETRDRFARIASWTVAAVSAAATAIWLGLVARSTGSYLTPHFTSAWNQLLQLVGAAHSTTSSAAPSATAQAPPGHTPFTGSMAPAYERLAGVVAPFVILITAAIGLVVLWRRRREGDQARVVAPFVLLAGTYFLSLPFALTTFGGEIAHRSWAFSYVGLGVVASFAFGTPSLFRERAAERSHSLTARTAIGIGIAVLAVGNIAAGENVLYRFPGPYLFGSDSRSATAEQKAAVEWLASHVEAGAGVATDRFTAEAITAYTRLRVPDPTQSGVFGIYLRPELPAPAVRQALRAGAFEYFILDTRIEDELPAQAFFAGYNGPQSVNSQALRDLSRSTFISAPVYRSAHYAIYRISP